MKILLDENIPAKLRMDFGVGYDVKTVKDMLWLGKKNGELLGLMVLNGFDFFITLDKNLKNQQNLDKFEITIFLLFAINNKHQTLQPFIEKIKKLLDEGGYKKFNNISV